MEPTLVPASFNGIFNSARQPIEYPLYAIVFIDVLLGQIGVLITQRTQRTTQHYTTLILQRCKLNARLHYAITAQDLAQVERVVLQIVGMAIEWHIHVRKWQLSGI